VTDFLTELREELLDGLERYERVPRWRRRRIRFAVGRTVAAAVAAAASLVAIAVVDRPPDVEQGTTPAVSRLEGFHASGLVVFAGSVWISQYDSGSLMRIDQRTGSVRARIDVGGSPGTVIAADGAVWVHDWERGRLMKVDPRTNRVTETVDLGQANGDIAFAAGAVWAIGERGMLLRIDAETATISRPMPLDGVRPPTGPTLAAAGDTLWVAAGTTVIEIDARTGDIVGRAHGPFLPTEFARRTAADGRGLWISSPTRRELLHVDARTQQVTRHSVAGDPHSIALVDGRIWVATIHETDPLTRVSVFDDAGRAVGTIPLPYPAVSIVASPGGGAWVTFGEDRTYSPAALHLSWP
jgi:streptogramin lyase